MAKYKNNLQAARDFDPYADGVSRADLLKIRRQLAKVMNQRMLRLEQAKSPVTGEQYTFGSYEKMQDYLEGQGRTKTGSRPGGLRFDERLNISEEKMTDRELINEIRKLQNFEQQKSSRVAGMHAIEKQREKTFIEKGLSKDIVKSRDFYDFMNSQTWDNLSRILDSDRVNAEYNRVAGSGLPPAKIEQAMSEYLNKADRVSVKGLQCALDMAVMQWETTTTAEENPFT